MNYTEAVNLAKAGDERGFSFLYEKTYKSKFYLALQYTKDLKRKTPCCFPTWR